MKLQTIFFALLCTASLQTTNAQSGIGVIPINADYALHIKTSSVAQDPLRLEGLSVGTVETSVLVTDANGRLTYRPAADLLSASSLWINTAGDISPLLNRPVAIGQTGVAASVMLDVNGNQRMEATSQLQFRDNQNYIYSPTSSNYWYFKGRDYVSFRNNANTTDIFTVRAVSNRIGILNDNPDVDFEVSGTQRMTGGERLEFRDPTNYIYSPNNNNYWFFRGQQYVIFQDRDETVDILTVQANTDRVGILTRSPQVDFEVNGTQRMRDVNQLQFGGTSNYIYARNAQDFRFHGFTETNFMNRAGTDFVLSLDANTERVGIRTNNPDVVFDVASNASLTSTGGGVAHIGDGTYVGISQNQIGAYNGSSTSPLHLQQFGNSVIIGANNTGLSLLDARGSARIGVMPAVASDNFVVTANAAGDLRNVTWANAIAALGDNLGNHTATQNVIIEAEHEIRFNSANKFIARAGQDMDIATLDGEVHVHAENFIVTNEAIRNIAHFDGNTRRVGFGEESNPDATVHIEPVGSDFPLRVESIPVASSNGNIYRRLIVDGNGYVFRGRSPVNRNGFTSGGSPNTYLRPVTDVLSRMTKVMPLKSMSAAETASEIESSLLSDHTLRPEDILPYFPQAVDTSGQEMTINYSELAAISFAATRELHAENEHLRAELEYSQEQQQEAMNRFEEKLVLMSSQIEKLNAVEEQVKGEAQVSVKN